MLIRKDISAMYEQWKITDIEKYKNLFLLESHLSKYSFQSEKLIRRIAYC